MSSITEAQLAEPLAKDTYLLPTLEVSELLIGRFLCKRTASGLLAGRIVEVEAYLQDDPASHSYHGRTKRNTSMFEQAGIGYVYLIYGVHWCFNVVTQPEHVGEAILIRSLEPVIGFESMSEYERTNSCKGPGKLCKSFGITGEIDAIDLAGHHLWISQHRFIDSTIVLSKRIGITKAVDYPWRYHLKDCPFVSGKPNRAISS